MAKGKSMRFIDLIRLIFENLGRHKGRVILTAVGVIIGTSAVVVLVSLGIGLQKSATENLWGMNDLTRIEVSPGYYYEEMTMKEIGATLDLSESRVSQMHSSILARLKAQIHCRKQTQPQHEVLRVDGTGQPHGDDGAILPRRYPVYGRVHPRDDPGRAGAKDVQVAW